MSTVPRPEYPRPQFRRDRWTNLNGEWSFAFDDGDVGLAEGWQGGDGSFFGRRITVPFCFQAELSGIGETTFHDVVWYARTFEDVSDPGGRLLMHFGAVDYRADVWVNGVHVVSHEGGHTPFSADVTRALNGPENVVVVRAEDPSRDVTIPRGKQYWREESEGIFYTRTTGIWQTVWLEPVNRARIESRMELMTSSENFRCRFLKFSKSAASLRYFSSVSLHFTSSSWYFSSQSLWSWTGIFLDLSLSLLIVLPQINWMDG